MSSDWIDDVNGHGAEVVGRAFGLSAGRRGSTVTLSPCPSCRRETRGERDKSGPIGIADNIKWKCHPCGTKGDAFTLAALLTIGERSPKGERLGDVRQHCADKGLCQPDERNNGKAHTSTPRPTPPPLPQPTKTDRQPMDPAEVLRVWNECAPVSADPDVCAWLRSRGLDPKTIEGADLARALTSKAKARPLRFAGSTWFDAGFRCVLPLYDAAGRLCSLRGRRITDETPKAIAPIGPPIRGHTLADPIALAMLRGQLDGESPEVWLTEGEPDFLTLACEHIGDERAPAVFGLVASASGWSDEHTTHVPKRSRVIIATDADAAGDTYAIELAHTLNNFPLYRRHVPRDIPTKEGKPNRGEDLNDEKRRTGTVSRSNIVPMPSTQAADLDREAPTLAQQYDLAALKRDADRELISLENLPGRWRLGPRGRLGDERLGPDTGHGIGKQLNELLAGGVCPGYMLALGATSAGAGKTAFAMQIADGLALRAADVIAKQLTGAATPVIVMSEMSAAALTWRSLARWTGCDSRIFRAGKSAHTIAPADDIRDAQESAQRTLSGDYGRARDYIRVYRPNVSDTARLVDGLAYVIDLWRQDLLRHTADVWPVVVIDPIQRWQQHGLQEVEALNSLVEAIGTAALAGGWVVIATSDTNKTSAAREGENERPAPGPEAFRGSYKLIHLADAAVLLDSNRREPGKHTATMTARIVKNRWGSLGTAEFSWDVKTARFTPSDTSPTVPGPVAGPDPAKYR